MIAYDSLKKEIHDAFPHEEAPEEFREYCRKIINETPDFTEYGLGDYETMALAYKGKRWWELSEEYENDGNLSFMIDEYYAFLRPDAWRYYIPMFLISYLNLIKKSDWANALSYTITLQGFFGENYMRPAAMDMTLEQKKCVAQVIKSAATDLPELDNHITPETLAYWSRYL